MKRIGDDSIRKPVVEEESGSTAAEEVKVELPQPNPMELRKRLRMVKGDGITDEKPRLPSESNPDVRPKGAIVPNGGHGHGVPPQARGPVAGFQGPMEMDPGLANELRRNLMGSGVFRVGMLAPAPRPAITTQQASSGPQIPEALVGLSADRFYAAYQAALKKSEPWAKELEAFGKAELARVERTARFSQPVPDRCGTNGSGNVGGVRDVAAAHLAFCRAAGEPWAIALSGAPERSGLPALIERCRRDPKAAVELGRAYREAVTAREPEALALQEQATAEVRRLAAELQSEADFIAPEQVDTQVAEQVQRALEAGEPWAVAAKEDQAAQIPGDLLPITEENAAGFRQAYRDALEKGERWAVELQAFAAEKLGELDQAIDRARATSKVTGEEVFEQMRASALEEAREGGEPWAHALLAEATPPLATPEPGGAGEVPSEWPNPLPAEQVPEFKAAFLEAMKYDEPWALELLAQAEQNVAALEDKLADHPRPGQAVAREVTLAAKRGEPWALAMKAEGELRLEQAEQKKLDQATNTQFLAQPPEVGVGNKKDHNRVKNQVAADGSMKVPSPKEAFVNEYVRTNPIVQQLREGGLANIYVPLYQQHLASAVEAAGRGEAPPAGKGFLALTNHGFAYCYNPARTPEENARIAELSLLSGMTFEQCKDARVGTKKHNDGKFEDALEVFRSFDPTKKGELKIALDGSAKGKVEIVLRSDGQGSVSAEHHKKASTWTKIGRAVAQYGLPVAALVCAVVPGLQGVAALCVSTASAVKGVVDGIRNKDWLGAVLGAVGAVGGVLQIVGKAGGAATSALASTGSKVSQAARALEGVRGVISGIKDKSLSTALMGVANAAGGLAAVVPDAKGLGSTLEAIAKHAKQFGEMAAFGEAGVRALKGGDYLGAFVAAVKLGATAGKSYLGLDPKVAEKLIEGATVMKSVGDAVKNKDWTGAIATLLNGVKSVTGSANRILDAGATLAGVAQALAHSDPMGAAKLAFEFTGKLVGEKIAAQKKLEDPSTPEGEKKGLAKLLAAVEKQLAFFAKFKGVAEGLGAVVTAVKAKDAGAILEAAVGVVGELTKSGKLSAARDVIAAARAAYQAAKSGDQIAAMQAASKLGQAIRSAIDSLPSDEKERGEVPDPTAAITGALPPAEAAAAEGYRVRLGDTLPEVAKRLLGDSNRWPELYAYNRNAIGDDPTRLTVGTPLELPPPDFAITSDERAAIIEGAKGKLPAAPPPAGAPVAPPDAYTTRPGDSLAAIAKRALGSSAKWPELYEYNKELLGEDPSKLAVGVTLKLPPADFTLSAARRKEIVALAKGTPAATGSGPAAPSGPTLESQAKARQRQLQSAMQTLTDIIERKGGSYLSFLDNPLPEDIVDFFSGRGKELSAKRDELLKALSDLNRAVNAPASPEREANVTRAMRTADRLLAETDDLLRAREGTLTSAAELSRVVRDTCALVVATGSAGVAGAAWGTLSGSVLTACSATLKALSALGDGAGFVTAITSGLAGIVTAKMPGGETFASNFTKEVASALVGGVDKYLRLRDAAVRKGTWKEGDSAKLWESIMMETIKNAPAAGVKAAIGGLKGSGTLNPSALENVFVGALTAGWRALPVPK